jgi:CubicO group peptidase (beta-lactamase class C family)
MKAFGLVAVAVLVTAASACSGTRRPDIETHATPGEDVLASPPDSIERALDAFGVGVQPSGRVSLSHSGAFVLGAATNFVMLPESDIGIVVLTNAAPVGGGALDGRRVLSRKTLELMTTNHLPGDGDMSDFALPMGYGEVGFAGNGFGLTVAVSKGPQASSTVGSAGAFMWGGAASTTFWVDPAEELAVVFMTQLMPSGTFNFGGQLRSLVYAALL